MTVFSWTETGLFLAATAAVGGLLYPSEYTRGIMHRDTGDRSRAVSFLQDYLKRNPGHKGAILALGDAYEAGGRPEEAVAPLLAFYRHRRGDLETGRALLGLMDRAGLEEPSEAFRWELISDLRALPAPPVKDLEAILYQAFQGAAARQDDEGTTRALAALAEVSGDAEGYRGLMIRLLLERGRLDAAVRLLGDAAKRSPLNAELRRTVAHLHALRGDEASALAELDDAARLMPRDTGLLADRAELHARARRWGKAEADFRRLVELAPGEPAWSRELARCLLEQGGLAEAVGLYEGLIRSRPEERERWWNLIYAYSDRGLHDDAARRLKDYLARFPGDEEAAGLLVHEYESGGRLDEAIRALQERVRLNPQNAARRKSLANLLMEEERLEEAVEQHAALAALEPDAREHWMNLANVQETLGRHREAAASLEGFLARFPKDGKAAEHLAGLYLHLGEKQKSIEVLRRYFRGRDAGKGTP